MSSQTNVQENKESPKPVLTKPDLPVDQVESNVKETETKDSQKKESNSNIVPPKIYETEQENDVKLENVKIESNKLDIPVSNTEKVEEDKNDVENEKTQLEPETATENGDISNKEVDTTAELLVNGHNENKSIPTCK